MTEILLLAVLLLQALLMYWVHRLRSRPVTVCHAVACAATPCRASVCAMASRLTATDPPIATVGDGRAALRARLVARAATKKG